MVFLLVYFFLTF